MALHAKAKAEAGYRFYALVRQDPAARTSWRMPARPVPLQQGRSRAWTASDFADVEAYGRAAVARGTGAMRSGTRTYRPDPMQKSVHPESQRQTQRPLGISTLRDRVCMTAAMLVLEPIFEADLPPRAVRLPAAAATPSRRRSKWK
ncbi:MAG: hypothetical protein MZV63_40115 [Marinilabiliales bacterium]|nr:hypothetical protein [Marinilabiliales bacterium]